MTAGAITKPIASFRALRNHMSWTGEDQSRRLPEPRWRQLDALRAQQKREIQFHVAKAR
jgi:hypothetical protein